VRALAPAVVGGRVEGIAAEMVPFWRSLAADPQLRRLGPEKGVIHSRPGPATV
jgi:L-fuconate dehydratase